MSDDQKSLLKNAYYTLGLNGNEKFEEVKKAHRALARALHPDRNPDTHALMARINGAYNLLEKNLSEQTTNKSDKFYFSRIIHNFKNWLTFPVKETKDIIVPPELSTKVADDAWRLIGVTRNGKKLTYQVEIKGNPKVIALPYKRRRPCPDCQGTGNLWNHGQKQICPLCTGKGYVSKLVSLPVELPDHWESGSCLKLENNELSSPVEVELIKFNAKQKMLEN